MNECVQCRGCEGRVPLVGAVRSSDGRPRAPRFTHAVSRRRAPARRSSGSRTDAVTVHALLLAVTWVAWLLQRLHLLPRRLGLPRLSARSLATALDAPRGGDPTVWCFTGCVMDAWLRDTHRSTVEVMRACGAEVSRPGRGWRLLRCAARARGPNRGSRAAGQRRVIASMPGAAPVLVNSAGCGAVMKDYGRMLGTPEAEAFSARVRDFSEWVVEQGLPALRPTSATLVVQDPCHLRHVQRAQGAVRTVLAPAYVLAETDDDGLCCGAGGTYAVLQPELATNVRDRKAAALRRAGAKRIRSSSRPTPDACCTCARPVSTFATPPTCSPPYSVRRSRNAPGGVSRPLRGESDGRNESRWRMIGTSASPSGSPRSRRSCAIRV